MSLNLYEEAIEKGESDILDIRARVQKEVDDAAALIREIEEKILTAKEKRLEKLKSLNPLNEPTSEVFKSLVDELNEVILSGEVYSHVSVPVNPEGVDFDALVRLLRGTASAKGASVEIELVEMVEYIECEGYTMFKFNPHELHISVDIEILPSSSSKTYRPSIMRNSLS